MRPLEVVMLLSLVPVVGALFLAPERRPRWWRPLTVLPVLIGVAHVLVEGYRWQMVPAYVLAVLVMGIALARARAASDRPRSRAATALRLSGAASATLGLIVAALLPALFPVFRLPQPTGRHAVGFTRFALIDSTRDELFSASTTDRREVMVEAWYPTDAPSDQRAMFWGPPLIAPRIATALGLPAFLFDHLAHVRTHAYVGAPPAAAPAPFPVLIFSHGINQGFAGQNTVQMEELASHGYAVFSIAHPYESVAVAFPDGRVVAVSATRMDSIARGMGTSAQALRSFAASTDRTERALLFRKAISEPRLLHESLRVWTEDTRFVLDELTRFTAGDTRDAPIGVAFAGRLDLSRVGVFGMSFGGTTAGQVCVVEPRCSAGVNLDGTQYGDPIDVPLRVPFMFMTSSIAGLNDPVYERAMGPAYSVNIEGSTHFNYTDFSLLSPVFRRMGFLGSIDGARMQRIMNDYLLAFFDTYVKREGGQHPAVLDSSSSIYPEVQLSSRAP
ncbi:MAG: alpha/beta hydrolase family protein [Gemmatimonadaceae bacterium]